MPEPPRAFLCHGSIDVELTARLARDLTANGVEVWYDAWCIQAGDSLRRKIDAGIEGATHFLAVLSRAALDSEWVRTELDAGMVRRIEGECRLIPILVDLEGDELPATLRGIKCVRLDPYSTGLEQLLAAFHGRATPALGPVPDRFHRVLGEEFGLSPDAQRVARYVCERATNGHPSALVTLDDVASEARLDRDDLAIAIDELVAEGLLREGQGGRDVVMPEWELFFRLDPIVNGWDPEEDALVVASELSNAGQVRTAELASRLGWDARRMNPACAFLATQEIAGYRQFMGSSSFYYGNLRSTPRTLRFVRDRS